MAHEDVAAVPQARHSGLPSLPSRSLSDERDPARSAPQLRHIDIPTDTALHGDIEDSNGDAESGSGEGMLPALGPSIGHVQSRLLLPTTPSAEKSAAVDRDNTWGFFHEADSDRHQDELRRTLTAEEVPVTGTDADSSPERGPSPARPGGSKQSLPSPWSSTAWTKQMDAKSRPRSKTQSVGLFSDLSFKKLLANLPLPLSDSKATKTSPDPGGKDTSSNDARRPARSSTLFTPRLPWTSSSSNQSLSDQSNQTIVDPSHTPPAGRKRSMSARRADLTIDTTRDHGVRPALSETGSDSTLRPAPSRLSRQRSNSCSSLPQSALSQVSSWADDTHWEHIDAQVNTRLKAIKDSISDSMPDLPNLRRVNLWPDAIARKPGTPSERSRSPVKSGARRPISQLLPNMTKDAGSASRLAPSKHAALEEALEQLQGDIVVLGGYRGSVLRAAQPPHRQLWIPVKVGLNIRKVNLEVGLEDRDEETMEERIFPSSMLTHIGPVDISRRLLRRLEGSRPAREGRLRVHNWAYDWRLSPDLTSRSLIKFLSGLPSNQSSLPTTDRGAWIIAHSLGGLITRHAINARPELFAGVVYAGVPQHCVNILGPFRNGDEVLLSSKVLTAQVNFSMRTSFALLPESGQCFIDKDTKEQYPVDFFDVESWKRYAFSPCVASVLPAWPTNGSEKRGLLTSITDTLAGATKPTSAMASQDTLPTTQPSSGPSELPPSSSTESSSGVIPNSPPDAMSPPSHALNMSMSPPPPPTNPSTISADDAIAYLKRTLPRTLRFKQALTHKPEHTQGNRYPPLAVLYGASMPTVYGARVRGGRQGIARADAYDDLAFASGDGVVLARAAMLPTGYQSVPGGRVRTERGHVGLLADLEGVGRCLAAVIKGRRQGIGLGEVREG